MTKEKQDKPQLSIGEWKAEVCKRLMVTFEQEAMSRRLIALAMRECATELDAAALVMQRVTAFTQLLMMDDGAKEKGSGDKRYLVDAAFNTLVMCFLESMQSGIPIDGRKLCHIIVYDGKAQLDIDYRGFIYYINKHYNEANVEVQLVFKGDTFAYGSKSGDAWFDYAKDPKRTTNSYGEVEWAFVYITYLKGGRERSRIEVLDRRDLDTIRGKNKGGNVWNEWTGEMFKKAAIRRACKLPLAAIDENAISIEAIDNKNFQLEGPGTSGDKLKLLIAQQREVVNGPEKKPEPEIEQEKKTDENKQEPDAKTDISQSATATEKHLDETPTAINDDTEAVVSEEKLVNDGALMWDGKTVNLSENKKFVADITTPSAALAIMRREMKKLPSRSARWEIITANNALVEALIKDGKSSVLTGLRKLADEATED